MLGFNISNKYYYKSSKTGMLVGDSFALESFAWLHDGN
jgi:hypothetical protein